MGRSHADWREKYEITYEEVWEIVVELLLFLNLRIFFIDGDFLSCVVDCEVFVSTRVVLEFPVSS